MYLVVLYIFIRWKGRVTIIVTITFLRKYALTTPTQKAQQKVLYFHQLSKTHILTHFSIQEPQRV